MFSALTPESYARELLFELKVENIPTPVYDICNLLKIDCIETEEIDAEALLYKSSKGKISIYINAKGSYISRKRLTCIVILKIK